MQEDIPSPAQDPSQRGQVQVTEWLDRNNAAELLAAPEARRQFILGLSNETFQQWLIDINGAVRGVEPQAGELDGVGVEVASMMPPEDEDKHALLGHTLDAAKQILTREQDPEASLEDVSLLLGGAINYIHPFNDGNGRTARIAGLLIREGYDGGSEAQAQVEAVSRNGNDGRKVFQNAPAGITKWLNHAVAMRHKPEKASQWPVHIQIDDGVAGENIDEKVLEHINPTLRSALQRVLRDPDFGHLAASKIMLERGVVPEGTEIQEYEGRSFAWTDADTYFAKFSDQDIEAMLQESRGMRYDRIMLFIAAMTDPESFSIETPDSHARNLRDYYADRVNNHSSLYKRHPAAEIGRMATRTASS
jgi:hypothetical protein